MESEITGIQKRLDELEEKTKIFDDFNSNELSGVHKTLETATTPNSFF